MTGDGVPTTPDGADAGRLVAERWCEVCRDATASSGAGITLVAHDRSTGTICVTDDVTALCEELQFTLGEGPCLDAYDERRPVGEPDLGVMGGLRWPAFRAPAVAAGVRAAFGFPISVGSVRLGALDLYRDLPGPLTAPQHADALRLADAAGVLILEAQAAARPGRLGDALAGAESFRLVVHQAAGMIAAQLDVPVVDALRRLRAHAFVHDVAVADVAREVVGRRLRFDEGDRR